MAGKLRNGYTRNLIHYLRIRINWQCRSIGRFSTRGLKGVPITSVIRYFFKGIINGAITTRASSVAFSFFLATVPTLIFIFTLIPYIPVSNFQEQLLSIIKNSITGLPAFKLAIAPGSINAKSNSSQKHNDQPLKKEPQPGAVETQPSAFNVGISTYPALLR